MQKQLKASSSYLFSQKNSIIDICHGSKYVSPANIRLDEDVLKTSLVFVFRRRLDQDEYICLCHTPPEYVFKTSSGHLDQDQYVRLGHTSSRRFVKMSSRHLQDIFKTSCQNVFKTSSKHLQDVLQKSLQDIFKTSCKDDFKTFRRCMISLNCLPRSLF